MEEYIDQIEKYLRGRMNQQEINKFKASLTTNPQLRSLAIIVVNILKNNHKDLVLPIFVCIFATAQMSGGAFMPFLTYV